MDKEAFLNNFISQLEDNDGSSINFQTRFHSEIEGWNSLTLLCIIAMIDTEYSVTIKGEDIKNSKTIEDLYNIVKTKMENKF